MYYPPPKKAHHWKTKLRERPEPKHKIVRKEIHGQMVLVKVYEPAYAVNIGEQPGLEAELERVNRFARERGPRPHKKGVVGSLRKKTPEIPAN
jgi:hypothetical protein